MEDDKNKIASNTLVQIVGRIFVLALSLVSIKLITNYLGPSGTGYYNTVITYLSFFIVIADFGLFTVAVREIAKFPEKRRRILANTFSIRLWSSIIVTILAIFIAGFTNYPNEIKRGVMIAALFPIFNLTGSIYDVLFQVKLQMQKVVIAEAISKIFAIVGVYLAVIYNLGFYAIIATVSLAALINFLTKLLVSKKELPFKLEHNKEMIIDIIKMSAPFGIVFIVNNIYFKIDTLILFYYKGAVDVGIYAVAYRVLETTLFAGSYLSSSLKPLLSVSIREDKEKVRGTLSQAITFLLFMSLAIAVICFTFSKEIILLLSNSEFVIGKNALIILGFVGIFIYISGLFGEIMIAMDKRATLLKTSLFILVFNIGLNIYLIPKYSFIGAAYSTLVSEIILTIIGFVVTKKLIEIKFDLSRIFKLIFISFVASIFGFLMKQLGLSFIANLFIVTIIYCFFAYFSDAIPKRIINEYLLSLKLKWLK